MHVNQIWEPDNWELLDDSACSAQSHTTRVILHASFEQQYVKLALLGLGLWCLRHSSSDIITFSAFAWHGCC